MGDQTHQVKHAPKAGPAKPTAQTPSRSAFAPPNPFASFAPSIPTSVPAPFAPKKIFATNSNTNPVKPAHPIKAAATKQPKHVAATTYGPTLPPKPEFDFFKKSPALLIPQDPFGLKPPVQLSQYIKSAAGPSRTKIKLEDARKTLATFVQREGSFYELVLRTSLLNSESQHLTFRKQVNTATAQSATKLQHELRSNNLKDTKAKVGKQIEELEKQDRATLQLARNYRELSDRSSKFVKQMYIPNQGMSALAGYGQCIDSINKSIPQDEAARARLAKAVALLSTYESIREKSSATEANKSLQKSSQEAIAQNARIEKRLPHNQKRAKELNQVATALIDHPEIAAEFIKAPAAALNATPTMFRPDLMLYIDRQAGGIRDATLTKDNFQEFVQKWNIEHAGQPNSQIEFSAKEFELVARRSGRGDSICRSEFEEECGVTLPDIDSSGAPIPGTMQPLRTALADRNFVEFLKTKYSTGASAQTIGMNESEIHGIVGQWNRDNPTSQVRFDSESIRLFNLWATNHTDPDGGDVTRVLPQSYLVRADHEVRTRELAAQNPDAFIRHRANQEMEALRDTIYAVENGRDASRLENKYEENYGGLLMWEMGHISNFGLNLWDSVSGSKLGSWKLDSKLSDLEARLKKAEEAKAKGDTKELAQALGLAYTTAGQAGEMLTDHVQKRDMVTRVTRTIVVTAASTTAATLLTPVTAGGSWAVAGPIIASTATGMLVESSFGALEAQGEGRQYTADEFRRDLGTGGLTGFGSGVFAPAGKAIDALATNASGQVANLGLKGATARFLPGVTKVVVNSTLNGTASAGVEGITAATEGDFDHLGDRMVSAGKTGFVMTAGFSLASKGYVAAKDGINDAIQVRRVTDGISSPLPPSPASYIGADGTLHGSTQPPIVQFNSQAAGSQFGQANKSFDYNSPIPPSTQPATHLGANSNFHTGPVNFVPSANQPKQFDRWLDYSGRANTLPKPPTPPIDPPIPTPTDPPLPPPRPNTSRSLTQTELEDLRTNLHDPVHAQTAVKKLLADGTQGQKVLAEELKHGRKLIGSRKVDSKVVWEDFLDELPANNKLSPELLDALRNHKWSVTGSFSPRARKTINQALEQSTFLPDRAAIPELTKRLSSVRNGDSYRAAAALAELGDEGIQIVLDRIGNNGFFSGARGVGRRVDALRGLSHVDMQALSDANQLRLVKAVKQVSKEATAWYSIRNRFARSDAAVAVAEVFENATPAVKKELVESAARLLKSNKAAREALNLALTNAAKDSPELRDAVASQMLKNLRNRDPNIRKSAYENLGKIGAQQGLTLEEISALERRTHAFRWGMPAELRRSGRKLASSSLNDLTIIPKNGSEFSTKEITGLVKQLGDPQLSEAAGKALASQPPANVTKQIESLLNKDPFVRTFGVRDLRRAQIEACETLEQLVKQHGVDDVLSTGLKRRLRELSGKLGKRNSQLKDAAKAVLQSARASVATP